MRTHYDNLHVSEKASPEVIRGAYKALAQKWHPDKHPDQREKAERYFKIINKAFDILSDPKLRVEYDAWLAAQRSADSVQPKPEPAKEPPKQSQHQRNLAEARADGKRSQEQGFTEKDCPYSDALADAWQQGFLASKSANKIKPIQRPSAVKNAVRLLCLTIAIGIIRGLANSLDSATSPDPAHSLVFLVIVFTFIGYIVAKINEGANWARFTFLILFILGIYSELLTFYTSEFTGSVFLGYVILAQIGLQFAALILMFGQPASPWFSRNAKSPIAKQHQPSQRGQQQGRPQEKADPANDLRRRFAVTIEEIERLSVPSKVSVGHSINMANSIFIREFSSVGKFQSLSDGARAVYILKMVGLETTLQMKNNDRNEVLGFSLFRMYLEAVSLNNLSLFREIEESLSVFSAAADAMFGDAFRGKP